MLSSVARVSVSTLTAMLVLGLCTTTAEARGVPRVSGVSLLAQDWDDAKLRVSWDRARGATRYAMRVSSTKSRLKRARIIRTRTAEGTSTRRLRRDRDYYIQVRAIRKRTRGPWSRAVRLAFTPPDEGVSVPTPPGTDLPATPPVAPPVSEPPLTPPVTDPVTDPVTPPVTDPVTPPVTDPVTPPVTDPVTPPSAPSSTLFGFWAGSDSVGGGEGARANYDRVSGYLGTPKVYRMFFPGSPGTKFVGSNADFGPPVVVSFKFKPQEVVTGKWDATMTAWFNSIPATRQVWWSYFHEPENDIEAGSYTAAQYRAAWAHLTALAPERANLHPTLILMRYSLSLPTKRPIESYVTTGLEVLCWDSYLTGSLTIKQVVEAPAAVSTKFGLDFAIGETAAKDPAKVNQFVKDLIPAAKTAKAKFVTWFETDKSGLGINEADWRMRPHPTAVSTWRQSQ